MEQMNYNLLFRWLTGLSADDVVWNPTVLSKNRERLMQGGMADEFFRQTLIAADERSLISKEHFTVDSTLLEAATSPKSFQHKGSKQNKTDDDQGNPSVSFHGEKRRIDTH